MYTHTHTHTLWMIGVQTHASQHNYRAPRMVGAVWVQFGVHLKHTHTMLHPMPRAATRTQRRYWTSWGGLCQRRTKKMCVERRKSRKFVRWNYINEFRQQIHNYIVWIVSFAAMEWKATIKHLTHFIGGGEGERKREREWQRGHHASIWVQTIWHKTHDDKWFWNPLHCITKRTHTHTQILTPYSNTSSSSSQNRSVHTEWLCMCCKPPGVCIIISITMYEYFTLCVCRFRRSLALWVSLGPFNICTYTHTRTHEPTKTSGEIAIEWRWRKYWVRDVVIAISHPTKKADRSEAKTLPASHNGLTLLHVRRHICSSAAGKAYYTNTLCIMDGIWNLCWYRA